MSVVDFGFSLAEYPPPKGAVFEREGFVPPSPSLDARREEQLKRAAEEGRKFELALRSGRVARDGRAVLYRETILEPPSPSTDVNPQSEVVVYLRRAS